ncbi:nitrilase-related carbon-nitrogen hydrolase [Achromobacter sp. JUb104]|uniref:nitrilase-related carbon-nitrogen hydrolase n=1 Tax=Achromobacter sp. JUb104 TaxID=2940590 RepID=UPI00216779FA|nr:nitrilase-related carbon-nitrogen hydrolase [Achromobacter sp. JUb104]MCS3506272.1 putative amidohydrolase [Achromobacter sp. JUb104]
MNRKFKAAVVQSAAVAFDNERTLLRMKEAATQARDQGASLVVFPEAMLGTYPKGSTFGAYVGGRSMQGRDEFLRYHRNAIDVPGPHIDELAVLAKDLGIYLVTGVIERAGGTLYCTVVFFDDKGSFLGKHRKLMPTGSERTVWGFGDGSTLPVYATDIGKLGAVICWENYMPLLRTTMYSKGVELYCAPTLASSTTWPSSMQHIAIEGRCFVFSANQYATAADYPQDYVSAADPGPSEPLTAGGSCIVDPFGNFLVGPNFEGAAVMVAEIDLDNIIRGKYDLDVVGHYARPDVFQLFVDERAKNAVQSMVNERPQADQQGG